MSRIHEALKKAAQERSAQLAAGIQPDIAVEIGAGLPSNREASRNSLADLSAPQTSEFLRYEQLVEHCAHPKWRIDSRSSVFDGAVPNAMGAERFRTLRSRLYQIAATRPLRRILITSSVAAEGKTFIAANLAQSMVRQPDRRVLLIDADLRASRLHLALGAPNKPGLTDYLRGDVDEYGVIQKGSDFNLCLIAGGQSVSNPSELLFSPRWQQLLDRVTPVFDWIIIDSPPALPVHDASSIADSCDGVLFVVRAGSTEVELAEKAATEFHDKKLLGVVLNRVDLADAPNDYYYGYNSTSD